MSCNNLIDNHDIKTIYESCKCIDKATITSNCSGIDTKTVNINLLKNNITINKLSVQREYHKNAPLRGTANYGKIVINKLFVLKDDYRGKKYNSKTISVNFHEKELMIYKKNDFVEIQLDAAWNGITHWPKLGYKFYKLEAYQNQLYTLWSSFFMKNFVLEQIKKIGVLTKYIDYTSIPEKYKKGFGEWLMDNQKNIAFPMYKAINQKEV